MYVPAISPYDPNFIFVACDMGGVYKSLDGGKSWNMVDKRGMREAISCPVFFHPRNVNVVFACGNGELKTSANRGTTWTSLCQNQPWFGEPLTAFVIDEADDKLQLAGTQYAAYRSVDGGRSWGQLNGVKGKVAGIYIDPTTPSIRRLVLIGTSEGVFRSDDSGSKWRDSSAGLPSKELRAFCGAANVQGASTAVFCTIPGKNANGKYSGGVYRSLDHGVSWQTAMGAGINVKLGKQDEWGADDIPQYNMLGMAKDRPQTVWVTTAGNGYWPPYHATIWRTDDGGANWRYTVVGDPRSGQMGVKPNLDPGWVTRELGVAWGGPPRGFAVNRANADQAVFTNDGETYTTRDGGATWQAAYCRPLAVPKETPAAKADTSWTSVGLEVTSSWQFAFDPHDADRAYICYTDIGFFRSLDRGYSWIHSVAGCPWRNTFYQIAFDPDVPGLIWAACSNQHDIPHWSNIEEIKGPGGVCISRDYGATWQAANRGLPEVPATSIVVDPKSPRTARTLYVALFDKGVYKSTDGGASWSPVTTQPGSPLNRHVYRLKFQPGGALFCTITGKRNGSKFPAPGGLYRTRDGGVSWEDLAGSLDLKWPGDVEINPADPATLYLAASTAPGFEQGGLYKTADYGKTWKRLLRESDFPQELSSYTHALFVTLDPRNPETVYLGAITHGLFVSRDGGKHWAEMPGLPFAGAQRVAFDPSDPAAIWVTTFGGGVWKGAVK